MFDKHRSPTTTVEYAVLGCLLNLPAATAVDTLEQLEKLDFTTPSLLTIYNHLWETMARQSSCTDGHYRLDPWLLMDSLINSGEFKQDNVRSAHAELATYKGVPESIDYHVDQLKTLRVRRAAETFANGLKCRADGPLEDLLDWINKWPDFIRLVERLDAIKQKPAPVRLTA
mgnify:CR=1 FL=1